MSLLIRKVEKNGLDFRRTWKFIEEIPKKGSQNLPGLSNLNPAVEAARNPLTISLGDGRSGSRRAQPAGWVSVIVSSGNARHRTTRWRSQPLKKRLKR